MKSCETIAVDPTCGKPCITEPWLISTLLNSKIFRKGIETVTENVHAAIEYGISNWLMIEGNDGVIIADTMTTREEAIEILAEFRKISSKPVRAIIYKHSHPDHVFGADVFAEGSDPAVYAHETTEQHVKQLLTEVRLCIGTRSMRMYGNVLAPAQLHNVGIGPFVGIGDEIVRQKKVTGRFGDYNWLFSIPAYSPFIYCKAESSIY